MMSVRRIFWRLFFPILLLASLSVAAIAAFAGASMRTAILSSVERDLSVRAAMLVPAAKEAFLAEDQEAFDLLCKTLGAETGTRFTLILPSGKVIADSDFDPRRMDDHAGRAEVRQALDEGRGVSTRFSDTLGRPLMYVAVPVRDGETTLGLARASVPVDFIDETLGGLYRRFAFGGVLMAALAAVASYGIARRFSRPLEEIHRSSERLVRGEREPPLRVADSTEIGGLAEAVNRISLELDERLRDLMRVDRELGAILSSVTEGIAVVDLQGNVVRLSSAAREWLGAPEHAAGRPMAEVLGHRGLIKLVDRILAGAGTLEEELELGADAPRRIEARGIPLHDNFGRVSGVLVVLVDRAPIRRLESLRRDFAAHVSHELKTPITAIKGFADTLLAGALEEPEQAQRFVGFIAEQSRQLEKLVDDLMDLARIERGAELHDVERLWHHLGPILESAASSLETRLREANAQLSIVCPPDLSARVNRTLVERAVVNLLDNALRYGGAPPRIRIEARDEGDVVAIQVTDEGEGIDPGEIEHLFQRFYRGPRSRGRHPGGSGLGLAIVKHIALAHRGSVRATSRPGAGATFEVRLTRY